LERYHESLESIERAIELEKLEELEELEKPEKPDWTWYTKGWLLERLGRHEKAIECYDEAIRLNPNCHFALNDKAYILASLSRDKETNERAMVLVDKALDLDPGNPKYLDTKGVIFSNKGNYDRALQCFIDAIGKDRQDADFWYHQGNVLANIHNRKKDYDKAITCYDEALEALRNQRRRDEALRLDDKFGQVHNAKAVALFNMKNSKEALKEARQAVALNPTLESAHENLAKLVLAPEGKVNFWEFWTASNWRKLVALFIVVLAALLVFQPLYFGNATVKIEVKQGAEQNKTITTTREHTIPQTNLIVVGLAILVLLSPEIGKAKVGPVELELSGGHQYPDLKVEQEYDS
jgi:tetratricopeptide (TPR) repeat protein